MASYRGGQAARDATARAKAEALGLRGIETYGQFRQLPADVRAAAAAALQQAEPGGYRAGRALSQAPEAPRRILRTPAGLVVKGGSPEVMRALSKYGEGEVSVRAAVQLPDGSWRTITTTVDLADLDDLDDAIADAIADAYGIGNVTAGAPPTIGAGGVTVTVR